MPAKKHAGEIALGGHMDWKGIVEKIIVAVVAGGLLACLGWFYTIVTAPRPNPLTVFYRWVEVPNPAYRLDRARTDQLDRVLLDSFGVKGLATFLKNLGYQAKGRLVIMNIKNDQNYRSKEIEIIAKEAAVFSPTALDFTGIQSRTKVAPLDPGNETTVYIVMAPWLYFEKPSISVLYEGKLVDTTEAQVTDDIARSASFVADYPFVLGAIFLIGLITIFIFAIALLAQLIFGRRLTEYTARHATKAQVQKQIEFIELVKKYNPQSMP